MPIVWVHAKSLHLSPTLYSSLQPYGSSPTRLLCPGILLARVLECPPPGDLPEQGIKTVSLCLLYWQMSWAFLFIYLLLFYSTITPLVIINLTRGSQNKNVILDIFLTSIYQIISKREIQLIIFCVGSKTHSIHCL